MRIEALELEGLHLITPEPAHDERGFFARSFSADRLAAFGLETTFVEWSISYNIRIGTLRGLHFQAEPDPETKIVRCVRGAIFDVAVDVRPQSPTFGRHVVAELSEENRRSFYIPRGFAHGFQSLTDHAEVDYHISNRYRPDAARGIRWDDPDLAIAWPLTPSRTISARDRTLPTWSAWRRTLLEADPACA